MYFQQMHTLALCEFIGDGDHNSCTILILILYRMCTKMYSTYFLENYVTSILINYPVESLIHYIRGPLCNDICPQQMFHLQIKYQQILDSSLYAGQYIKAFLVKNSYSQHNKIKKTVNDFPLKLIQCPFTVQYCGLYYFMKLL